MTSDLKTLIAEARQHHTFVLDEKIARQLAPTSRGQPCTVADLSHLVADTADSVPETRSLETLHTMFNMADSETCTGLRSS